MSVFLASDYLFDTTITLLFFFSFSILLQNKLDRILDAHVKTKHLYYHFKLA